ncbi:cupin domain-containing protein [Halopelagius longus]|uniref:Cupin domain-containing protein n=1 Tax=Halopelagius longus TaxID=1236180 RepID=A0A1H1FJM7_9EURY|nr:cupin domain-containing protein [Halopelagius longus]RDI70078.1 cupin domain-containing protein [Halopelagius longus]SDR00939.1 Cupin domain-containing protein [Halopelagius longus]
MSEITSLDEPESEPHAELFETRRPRMVRLSLDADERVPPHRHPGNDIVLHLVEGHLELTLDDETHELRAGQLARFSGEREISPYAVEPSTAVVVFAPAAED